VILKIIRNRNNVNFNKNNEFLKFIKSQLLNLIFINKDNSKLEKKIIPMVFFEYL
tara:strand:- start:1469 stop:1633 length:165 start_codon:yes stop_codon:yes gene_type:complete